MAALRSGPFDLWSLRAPGNLLLDIGPQLYGFVADLLGPVEVQHLAQIEARLVAMQHQERLPLAIVRPGIVVGPGTPLQNRWIGRWHGPAAVQLWGNGRNILPFVLIDDLIDGLIRIMERPDIEGQSFNLIGDPLLSARDYLAGLDARSGAQTRARSGALRGMWLTDAARCLVSQTVMQRSESTRRSLVGWKSRAHLARFSNDLAKADLGWQPEPDKAVFLDRAIHGAALFGF